MTRPQERHALIIGGSIAGLLSARVLADYFAKVTIIERDHYPTAPGFRKGTPQAHHAHALLMRGIQIIEDLFPEIHDKLRARGARPIDVQSEFPSYNAGGWRDKTPTGLRGMILSRDLLEWQVRQELQQWPQIDICEDQEVVGLLANADNSRITGVAMRVRNGKAPAANPTTPLLADLIIDASGRHSSTTQWLAALGYAPPRETVVDAHWGYASRIFRAPTTGSLAWVGLAIVSQPPANVRGGVIWPFEDDRWMVTIGGAGNYPPLDDAGFLDFTRQMPDTMIYDAIRDLEPLSPIYGYRDMANHWRHYEQLTRMPTGFIILGDAACALNPIYGQGMSMAAIGAMTLRGVLQRRQEYGMEKAVQQAYSRALAPAWQLSTVADYAIPGVTGGQPDAMTRLLNRYINRVIRAGATSAAATQAVIEVTHLVASPAALFRAPVLVAALRVR